MRLAIFLPVVVILALSAACGDDDDNGGNGVTPPAGAASATPAGDNEPTGAAVDVELVDFSVLADASAPAGEVTFSIENTGPDHEHEFVVIKTDLDAAALPTAEDGSVDEEGAGIEVIDEVEEFAVGGSETLTLSLDPGHYALICNVVHEEEGETFVHYDRGMHTNFTVE